MSDLQPTDEHNSSQVIIVIIHQAYLAMEINDIVFEALSRLQLDFEEVIVVLPKPPSRSILMIESLLHLFKAPERLSREYIEPVIGRALRLDGNVS